MSTLLAEGGLPALADGFRWPDYARKTEGWFRSAEGKVAAENILSYQSTAGNWPKNINTAAQRYTGRAQDLRGTFDNGATVGETRFLARAYRVTGEPRYQAALCRALDLIWAAQYPNGGWPQSYPPGRGYARHITFNDGTMVNLLSLVRDVAGSGEFDGIEPARRQRAREAFERGIQCILRCQVQVRGTLTAWCAQHDELTLEPRPARSYEHPSLSGAESAGIVLLLMTLERPSPVIVRAINAACQWFQEAKLTGIREVKRNGDKIIIQDPQAPPLWARFYEIGSGRPIFSGRDGVIKYDLAEIEPERRNGYAWYGDWGRAVLEQWAQWKTKQSEAR